MAGVTLKRRISDLVAANSRPYAEILTESFRGKIRERGVFGG
jgi:hypothetical protein